MVKNARSARIKKNQEGQTAAQSDHNKARENGRKDAPAENVPTTKPPNVRTLVGGPSWTGKTPQNLLHEHTQKQGWLKPEYNVMRRNEGFYSTVALSMKDKKTQELQKLAPLEPAPPNKHLLFKPTALEAKNFAAAFALFRVCSMKNLHMALPPQYRDFWKELEVFKKEDVKLGKEYLYAADPFQEQKTRIAAMEKAKSSQNQTGKQDTSWMSSSNSTTSKPLSNRWSHAPMVQIGPKIRRELETIIRSWRTWNPNAVKLSPEVVAALISRLSSRGFRAGHAEEAAQTCHNFEEALEWLLVHVPEDDLPPWSLPTRYAPDVTIVASDRKKASAISHLSSGGYSPELCAEFLEKCLSSEVQALEMLQSRLIGELSYENDVKNLPETSEAIEPWEVERQVIESIYGSDFENISNDSFKIKIKLSNSIPHLFLEFSRPVALRYPNTVPLLLVQGGTSAQARLSITRGALTFARTKLLGEQMIFQMVDWVERNVLHIIDYPGKLTDISNVTNIGSAYDPHISNRIAIRARREPKSRHPVPANGKASPGFPALRQGTPPSNESQAMLKLRQALPAWAKRHEISQTVRANQFTILVGETGSGKSTQAIQFVLDDLMEKGEGNTANIVCTQPRRLSAISLAERVAEERFSEVGQEVGFTIRGESKSRRDITKVLFMTTGVLLRRLETSGGNPAELVAELSTVTHIFVDEVHERSLDTDFLLVLLKMICGSRKELKVILMSATIDAGLYQTYFQDVGSVALVQIPGRTFPVEDLYLNDLRRYCNMGYGEADDHVSNYDVDNQNHKRFAASTTKVDLKLLVHLVQTVVKDENIAPGGLLIFVPGLAEISQAISSLQSVGGIHLLPLHSSLPANQQRRVFQTAPRGMRKVIVSTNIAETSITIPDIVLVINSGLKREPRCDTQSQAMKLETVWQSQAEGRQRRGRAGRVREGKCFHMYTVEAYHEMQSKPDPEILRTPLEQLCLSIKAMGLHDVRDFLSQTVTPPAVTSVDSALALLNTMGALDGERLTPLGSHMAAIPADLRSAKLLVYGALFGCTEVCASLAAILSTGSPFFSPQTKREEAKQARTRFAPAQGDCIADLFAFNRWDQLRKDLPPREIRKWCEENFLSGQILHEIMQNRLHFHSILIEIGLLPSGGASNEAQLKTQNRHGSCLPLVQGLILSALHPQTLRIVYPPQKYSSTLSGALPVDPLANEIKLFESDKSRVFIHPSSTLFSESTFNCGTSASFLSYFIKMETSKVFAREVVPANSFTKLMFGGDIELDTSGKGLIVDGMYLRGWPKIGVMIKSMRNILDGVLDSWIANPGLCGIDRSEEAVVDTVVRLLKYDGLDQ